MQEASLGQHKSQSTSNLLLPASACETSHLINAERAQDLNTDQKNPEKVAVFSKLAH